MKAASQLLKKETNRQKIELIHQGTNFPDLFTTNRPTPSNLAPDAVFTRQMPNGLLIEDLSVGDGAPTKLGKKVDIRYVGKLSNGKVFDSSKSRTFSFRLGTNQVIKGMDIGLRGMKVGGKRRLTIPASLGYGSAGAPPDIPPNATLIFEVELVDA